MPEKQLIFVVSTNLEREGVTGRGLVTIWANVAGDFMNKSTSLSRESEVESRNVTRECSLCMMILNESHIVDVL